MPMINEAIYSLYEGVAGVEEIDTIMKLGMSHPMGPLQLDPQGRSLKLVHNGGDVTAFSADACPPVEDADLWVPVFHSAA